MDILLDNDGTGKPVGFSNEESEGTKYLVIKVRVIAAFGWI